MMEPATRPAIRQTATRHRPRTRALTTALTTGLAAALALALPVLGGTGTAAAQSWDMPVPYGDTNFHTVNHMQFAADVETATNGALTLTVHPSGSLFKHPEIKNAVRSGQVPIGEFLLSRLSNENPMYELDSVPFLATSYADAEKLWQVSRPKIEALLAEEGLTILYAVPWPPQGLYADSAVSDGGELAGMKFRAYNTATERLAQLMDAVPTQVEVPDLAQAFSTGRVDAMVTSPSTGANTKAWDYLSHYYDVQAWLPKNIVVANVRALRSLDEETRNAIMVAADKAQARGWAASMEETDTKTKALKENGIEVAPPSDELKAKLQGIGATMTEEWLDRAGEEGAAVVAAFKSDS
ncbi:MAG: TRAP transporter substrate-binding protein [Pseudomonadota bacterium]